MNNTFYVWVKEFEYNECGFVLEEKIIFCEHFTAATDAMDCYTQLLENSVNEGWDIWETPCDIKFFKGQVIYTPSSVYTTSRNVQNIVAISIDNPYEE